MVDLRSSIFGQLVLQTGLVTEKQLLECLTYQEECAAAGKKPSRLGEIMAKKGFLTVTQVKNLLAKQHAQAAGKAAPGTLISSLLDDTLKADGQNKADNRFGGYEILEKLGDDARGVTVKARHIETDVLVTIKLLSPEVAGDSAYVARFDEYARKASALRHEHILRVLASGNLDGYAYCISEYAEGTSLRRMLETNKKITPAFVIKMGLQIASALEYAHARGFFHQDIKPSNILVAEDEEFKLSGFSTIPEPMHNQRELVQSSGDTPFYIAPEQATDEGALADMRTDIYSLGAVMFHLLAGQPPFHGDSMEEVLLRIAEEEPPALSMLNSRVPRSLEAVVSKMLAIDPDERYQSATRLSLALEAVQSELESGGKAASGSALQRKATTSIKPLPAKTALLPNAKAAAGRTQELYSVLDLSRVVATAKRKGIKIKRQGKRKDSPQSLNMLLLLAGAVLVCIITIIAIFFYANATTEIPNRKSAAAAKRGYEVETVFAPAPTTNAGSSGKSTRKNTATK